MAKKKKVTVRRRVKKNIVAKRVQLRAQRGYFFRKIRGGRVALMRGRSTTATFSCECDFKDGGCKVQIVGPVATCVKDGCSVACGWVVKVPGIAGAPTWLARRVR